MDRSDKVISSPPAANTLRNDASPARAAQSDASGWQSAERASFENALNKIRAREGAIQSAENAPEDFNLDSLAKRHVDEAQANSVNAITANNGFANENQDAANDLQSQQAAVSSAEVSGSAAQTADAQENAEADNVQGVNSRNSADINLAVRSTETAESKMAVTDVAALQTPGVGSITAAEVVSAPATTSASAPTSSPSSHVDAAAVSEMIRSLEIMPGEPSGQWTFGVLDQSSGIVALQLQRALGGGWQVNVAVDEAASFDQKAGTEELKMALLKEGHDVESVNISSEPFDDASGHEHG